MIFRDIVLDALHFADRRDGEFPRDRLQIQRATFCVADLYLKFLARVETPATNKVIVALSSDPEVCASRKVERLLNVIEFPWPFSFDRYSVLSAFEKKHMLLDTLHAAVVWLAEHESWDVEPLQAAYSFAIAHKLENAFFWKDGKSWRSPDGRFKARLYYTFGTETAEVYAVIYDKGNKEIGWKLLKQERAGDAIILDIIGKCEWASATSFVLRPRVKVFGGKNKWTCKTTDLDERPSQIAI